MKKYLLVLLSILIPSLTLAMGPISGGPISGGGGVGGASIVNSFTLPLVDSAGVVSINPATESAPGSMSAADKAKVDGNTMTTLYGGLTMVQASAPSALTATIIASAGNLTNGNYYYKVTYVNPSGETTAGTASAVMTASSGHQQGALSAIPVSTNTSVTARKIYRTKSGGSTYYLLTTISNNTTTTFTDNIADASLPTTQPPTYNGTGQIVFAADQQWPTFNQDTTGSAAKINGASIPTNAPVVGTNSSGQIISPDPQAALQSLGSTVSPPTAPTVALYAVAGNLNGTYTYRISYITASGHTEPGTLSGTVSPVNQQVNLTNIPVSLDSRVTARKIYRTTGSETDVFGPTYFVATLNDNTTTSYTDNIADASLGAAALILNTTGGQLYSQGLFTQANSSETAFGIGALVNDAAYLNSAFGYYALNANTVGNLNAAFGWESLAANTTGSANTALGCYALPANTTGSSNTAVGNGALTANTTGNSNTAMGPAAMQVNQTGSHNVAIGVNALYANTASYNVAIGGYGPLYANTTGTDNIAIGDGSMQNNTTGNNNTAIGLNSIQTNTTSSNNTGIGYKTLTKSTSAGNTAMGSSVLSNLTTGAGEVCMGYTSCYSMVTGDNNTGIGVGSLWAANGASGNTGTGYNSLSGITTGGYNVGVGYNAGGSLTSGANNTFIGYNSNTSLVTSTNSMALGYGATVTASNQIVIGNGSVTDTYFGSTTPSSKIYASGGSTNHTVCWKSTGQLGYCSAVVDSSGVCGTCN